MIIGIDEVGLGPIAGPVVAAAVLIEDGLVDDVRDSKTMAEHKRYERADEITAAAAWYAVAYRSVADINGRGITKCHKECLKELAKAAHKKYPQAEVIIDGGINQDLMQWGSEFLQFQIGGDGLIYQISAASLVAKAWRDRKMIELGKKFPAYGFERHKGYPTQAHVEALGEHGPTDHHRKKATNRTLSNKLFGRGKGREEEHYSIDRAREYVTFVFSVLDVLDDWSKGFVKSMRDNLKLNLDLTPRQKFFLKRTANEARKKKTKQKKVRAELKRR